ncbi:MAG: hypothetical protein ACTSRC_03690 [Candidatus Helarchaeota archaeon]
MLIKRNSYILAILNRHSGRKWIVLDIQDENDKAEIRVQRNNGKSTRRRKWEWMLIGLLLVIIGVISLILSQAIFKNNEILSAGFLGFGVVILGIGLLIITVAFYKLAHIEYGF